MNSRGVVRVRIVSKQNSLRAVYIYYITYRGQEEDEEEEEPKNFSKSAENFRGHVPE